VKHAVNRLFGMLQNKSAKIKPHFAGSGSIST